MERAGYLGHWWVWANEPCTTWQATAAASYDGPWDRPTAHPILVVNPTYDPATPHQAGKAMARELADARLLTLNGYGHTALDNPSNCVNQHAVRYFLSGVLPPVGASCEQDTPPFSTKTPANGSAGPRTRDEDGRHAPGPGPQHFRVSGGMISKSACLPGARLNFSAWNGCSSAGWPSMNGYHFWT
ncbi:alpha/beta hydrolase [Streptomyces sp. ISL-1]|uniref:alpha/beta hydrolase n=1 Tax=Streptomyces sp. ISL-1 TaxID=2817657 RepID=UPI0020355972|nr:alpha/beta hydrolase [Streptomyces sp. ISL-1]